MSSRWGEVQREAGVTLQPALDLGRLWVEALSTIRCTLRSSGTLRLMRFKKLETLGTGGARSCPR